MPPNKFSYICVTLAQNIKQKLYDYAVNVSKQYDNFKPFDLDQIHMTFIFLGSERTYAQIKDITNFMSGLDKETYHFESTSYDLFPPDKQNLLVVKFTSSDNIRSLRNVITQRYNVVDDYEWLPHITIGKFVGEKKDYKIMDFDKIVFDSNDIFMVTPYSNTKL